ncbi:phage tail family protein [Clostridium sp. D2Q-14]|uniref:distal tail protein Dit n=1 Tax=Anaeromonas gelatinilytica TaxID=2683194 RepID=UPI00193BD223|nr:distal tail protein Dit [Anaeromonas gelatinilytica]MBS4535838.1 phage tail family protein [Anaeromonas gelatinilytica]
MIFNSVDLTQYLTIKSINGRGLASTELESLSIPGTDGAYVLGKRRPSKIITVEADILALNKAELRKNIDKLNAIFDVDEDVPIVFLDEPNMTYYGRPEKAGQNKEYFFIHQGQFTIVCTDPYKYGKQKGPYLFENDAITIKNEGTAEAYPIIEATAKESVTSFMVTKGDQDFFMIGQPYDIDKGTIEQYPSVAQWRTNSLVGWSHMTEGFFLDDEVSGGTVSGSDIEVRDSDSFIPSAYGSSQSGWYGPAVRRSLPKSVGDFSITFGCIALNNGDGVGKVMAIFLDEDDRIVASIGLINSRLGTRNVRVLARLNDGRNIRRRRVMDFHGDSGPESTVFSGKALNIRLRREGNRFEAYTWQVNDNGVPHARHKEVIIDNDPDFQRPIRQVVLFFARYGNNPVFPMRIYAARVHDNNTLLMDEDMIPYIAHEGDKIVVDSKNELVMINDEPVTNLKAFGANYFMLDKVENNLFTFPENYFDTTVRWTDRYK